MGVTFSTNSVGGNRDTEDSVDKRNKLRLDSETVNEIVNNFYGCLFSPIAGYSELYSLLSMSDRKKCIDPEVVEILWECYAEKNVCFLQDVITSLVLLANADWPRRLEMIFNLFKSTMIDEMRYPDFILAAHTIINSLKGLWRSTYGLDKSEEIVISLVNSAFSKLEKNIDQGFSRIEFVHWASARFRESKTVSNMITLSRILSSEFADT